MSWRAIKIAYHGSPWSRTSFKRNMPCRESWSRGTGGAYRDGQGQALQEGEIDVHVERLGPGMPRSGR